MIRPANKPRPRDLVAQAVAEYGEAAIADWCAQLLVERVAFDDPDMPSLVWIGGSVSQDSERLHALVVGNQDYWPRVWAARALMYAWDSSASTAVCQGLGDSHWRVREMSAKVVWHREIGEAADTLLSVTQDEKPRVRAAAARALGRVGEAEAAEAIRECLHDSDRAVQRAAEVALERLVYRLDRDL